jgi:thymidylate kinase
VGAAFRRFAKHDPARFVTIDGDHPKAETHQLILTAVEKRLPELAGQC